MIKRILFLLLIFITSFAFAQDESFSIQMPLHWMLEQLQTVDSLHTDKMLTDTLQAWNNSSIEMTSDMTASGSLNFSGTFTDDVIDFSDVVINHTGSNGPVLIRGGTYASPIANADEDQSGLIRLYTQTSANGTSYDRGIFVTAKTTGTKGIFPIAGLAEVLAQTGAGPTAVRAGEFVAHMNSSTAAIGVTSSGWCGMAGLWAKITSNVGSATNASSVIAPLWVDNQMNGTVNGEEYGIYSTTGTETDAFVGFEATAGNGHNQLFYWDETTYNLDPVSGLGLKVLINTTQKYLPMSTTNTGLTIAGELSGINGTFTGTVDLGDATDDVITLNGEITSDRTYAAATTVDYFKTSLTATSGTHNNLRARVQNQAVGASTSDIRGVYGQATTTASLFGGTGTGVFGNFIAKNLSTTVTGRAGFFEAETEPTPTAITDLIGIHIRTKMHMNPSALAYGLYIENQELSTGFLTDAYIGFKSTTWGAGVASATYGIDMNAITGLSTGDLRLHNGTLINNSSASLVEITEANIALMGMVGIGTTTPAEELDVLGSVQIFDGTDAVLKMPVGNDDLSVIEFGVPASVGWRIGRDDIGVTLGSSRSFVIREETSGDVGARMVFKRGGNVGIGTTDPMNLLHLDAAGGADGTGTRLENASVSTSNAAATTIYTLATATNQAYRIIADIVGAQDDGSNSMGALHSFTIKNVAGTVTEQGDASIQETDDSAGVSVTGAVSGTNYLIQVTGINPENWNWEASIRITAVAH